MPLVCASLSREVLSKLNQEIKKLPLDNILHKESMDGDITVIEINNCALYHSAAGFYFQRITENLEQTIRENIRKPREYLCSAFELDPNDSSVQERVLGRFQESYGQKLFRKLDYMCFENKGIPTMVVKFPSCILRHMLAPSGGLLKTVFSGPTKSLLQLPTLQKLATINPNDPATASVFVTEYKKGMLPFATNLHYDIIRELVTKPNLGITVGPIAVWDS